MKNDRYWQVKFIASGGFAAVYRAIDGWTGAVVALKVLKIPTPDNVRRFQRESAMLTTHLNNPFVVDILASDLTSAAPYIVLEYSELGSLQKYVANRRDWWRIAGWLHDISCGLTSIHERGDFIRDIKPSNLLRFKDANGSELIKIADFGLGQRPDNPSGPMTASPFGTAGYIDPIAQITQNFTSASDVYSLGVTARELLTGNKDLRNPIPGPPKFQALVSSMTHLELNRRPTARQISQQLESILQTAAVPRAPDSGGKGLLWLLAGAAAIAVAANANSWDGHSQRYRDSGGRFRSGWLS
jgi:serine/threonine protein kinase